QRRTNLKRRIKAQRKPCRKSRTQPPALRLLARSHHLELAFDQAARSEYFRIEPAKVISSANDRPLHLPRLCRSSDERQFDGVNRTAKTELHTQLFAEISGQPVHDLPWIDDQFGVARQPPEQTVLADGGTPGANLFGVQPPAGIPVSRPDLRELFNDGCLFLTISEVQRASAGNRQTGVREDLQPKVTAPQGQ